MWGLLRVPGSTHDRQGKMHSSRALPFARLIVVSLLAATLTGCTPNGSGPSPSNDPALATSPISDAMVLCLSDEGWEVTRSIYGGVDGPQNLAPAQTAVFQAAYDLCAEATGWATPLSDFTEQQREELYIQELAERECLSDLGYPGEEAPSRQTYLDLFASADQYYAFLVLSSLSQGPYEAAIRACPPPTWFLNISGFDE
jgi:hypothetical protein